MAVRGPPRTVRGMPRTFMGSNHLRLEARCNITVHCTGNAPEPEQIITNLRNAPRTMRGSATPLKTTTGPTICCWSTCSSSRRRSKWTSCPLSAPSRYVVSGPIGELVNLTTNYMNLHEFVKKLPFVKEKKEAKDEFKECFMYRCISRLYNVY